jgi:hypothetical protein
MKQFNIAKEGSIKRIKNSNDPQTIFSEINRLQEGKKATKGAEFTSEEQTIIDNKLKELKDKGYTFKTKKGEILRSGENIRVDDNQTLLKPNEVTNLEKELLKKELDRREKLKQDLIKNGYTEDEAVLESELNENETIDIVSKDLEVTVLKNGIQEKSGKVAIRFISVKDAEQSLKETPKAVTKNQIQLSTLNKNKRAEKRDNDVIENGTIYKADKDIKLKKGKTGKRDENGKLITAHPDVKGSFFTMDPIIADEYARNGGKVIDVTIPKGATVEVVNVDQKFPLDEIRRQETELINNSKADVVKLVTMDGKGVEVQYIIPPAETKTSSFRHILRSHFATSSFHIQTWSETPQQDKATEKGTETPPIKTELENIGKTAKQIQGQIYKFFTSRITTGLSKGGISFPFLTG